MKPCPHSPSETDDLDIKAQAEELGFVRQKIGRIPARMPENCQLEKAEQYALLARVAEFMWPFVMEYLQEKGLSTYSPEEDSSEDYDEKFREHAPQKDTIPMLARMHATYTQRILVRALKNIDDQLFKKIYWENKTDDLPDELVKLWREFEVIKTANRSGKAGFIKEESELESPQEILLPGVNCASQNTWGFISAIPTVYKAQFGENIPIETYRQVAYDTHYLSHLLAAHLPLGAMIYFQNNLTWDPANYQLQKTEKGLRLVCTPKAIHTALSSVGEERKKRPIVGCPALHAKHQKNTIIGSLHQWFMAVAEKYYFPNAERLLNPIIR